MHPHQGLLQQHTCRKVCAGKPVDTTLTCADWTLPVFGVVGWTLGVASLLALRCRRCRPRSVPFADVVEAQCHHRHRHSRGPWRRTMSKLPDRQSMPEQVVMGEVSEDRVQHPHGRRQADPSRRRCPCVQRYRRSDDGRALCVSRARLSRAPRALVGVGAGDLVGISLAWSGGRNLGRRKEKARKLPHTPHPY